MPVHPAKRKFVTRSCRGAYREPYRRVTLIAWVQVIQQINLRFHAIHNSVFQWIFLTPAGALLLFSVSLRNASERIDGAYLTGQGVGHRDAGTRSGLCEPYWRLKSASDGQPPDPTSLDTDIGHSTLPEQQLRTLPDGKSCF